MLLLNDWLFLLFLFSYVFFFFFSSRRRHTRSLCDWSSDVCSSDLDGAVLVLAGRIRNFVPVHQHGSKVSELLRDRAIKSVPPLPRRTRLHPRHCFELRRVKIGRASCRERV